MPALERSIPNFRSRSQCPVQCIHAKAALPEQCPAGNGLVTMERFRFTAWNGLVTMERFCSQAGNGLVAMERFSMRDNNAWGQGDFRLESGNRWPTTGMVFGVTPLHFVIDEGMQQDAQNRKSNKSWLLTGHDPFYLITFPTQPRP